MKRGTRWIWATRVSISATRASRGQAVNEVAVRSTRLVAAVIQKEPRERGATAGPAEILRPSLPSFSLPTRLQPARCNYVSLSPGVQFLGPARRWDTRRGCGAGMA
jgi:hypothetical protein